MFHPNNFNCEYISIHSLRMEGDAGMLPRDWQCHISIHSLRMEGDTCVLLIYDSGKPFQSTPSAWRETLP